jgi:hypothetical protein
MPTQTGLSSCQTLHFAYWIGLRRIGCGESFDYAMQHEDGGALVAMLQGAAGMLSCPLNPAVAPSSEFPITRSILAAGLSRHHELTGPLRPWLRGIIRARALESAAPPSRVSHCRQQRRSIHARHVAHLGSLSFLQNSFSNRPDGAADRSVCFCTTDFVGSEGMVT